MNTPRSMVTDANLKAALSRRAAGGGAGELIADVLGVVDGTSQVRRPRLSPVADQRPATLLLAAALAAATMGGMALVAGSSVPALGPSEPGPRRATGPSAIAFVQATYEWDGRRDSFGLATPTVDDPRIVTLADGGQPEVVIALPGWTGPSVVENTLGLAVKWAPDGSRLAFVSHVTARGLYVVDRDGTNLTRITIDPEPPGRYSIQDRGVTGFAWSPDSRQIAYTSTSDTNVTTLSLVRLADSEVSELARQNANGRPRPTIAWAPDGKQIAFARTGGQLRAATHGIYVLSLDAARERLLYELDRADLFGFAWSPDGEQIAFSRSDSRVWRQDSGYSLEGPGNSGLWVIDADGSELRRINSGAWLAPTEILEAFDSPIAWVPDGTSIVTWVWDTAIVGVPTDGSGERAIVSGRDLHGFSLSPDGTRLVFGAQGGPAAGGTNAWNPASIHVIGLDGTGEQWIADGEYPDWGR